MKKKKIALLSLSILMVFVALWPGVISEMEWGLWAGKSENNLTFELSPNGKKLLIFTTSKGQDETAVIAIKNLMTNEYAEIFSTTNRLYEVRSAVRWLGNEHIFFLRSCGTGCRGLMLINTHTRQVETAAISYPSFSSQQPYTHFSDWNGQDTKMYGLASEVLAETDPAGDFLVFVMQDWKGQPAGRERVPFIRPQ